MLFTSSFFAVLLPYLPFAVHGAKTLTRYQFEQWFCGFTDREGNVQAWMSGNYVRTAFRISLHLDDIDTLYYIQTMLGVGSVSAQGHSRAVYLVTNVTDLKSIILPILLTHGLLTTKQLDVLDLQRIVNLVLEAGTSRLNNEALGIVKSLIAGMNTGRTNYAEAPQPTTVSLFWLLGFFEAEGTSGLRFGHPYLQVAQHANSLVVLQAIQATLLQWLGSSLVFSLTLNKLTNVYTLSITGIDVLYSRFLPHMVSLPFITRKSVDVALWAIVLHMYYVGVAYLPEGRELIRIITAYMNDGRYSTASVMVPAPTLEMIKHVLSLSPPLTRQPGMSQLEYAKAIVRILGVLIYIYDNGKLHSIHNSYAAAQEAVGIKRTSRIISRTIDTGRLYAGRYEFTSKPK
jgi:hypothetical protein